MKKIRKQLPKLLPLFFVFLGAPLIHAQTADQQKIIADAENARQTLVQHDSYMQTLFENSEGYVIFPNVGKGAYVVGGASGNGAVYEGGRLIGMADLKQLDVGLQLGGQAFIQVMFFGNQAALNEFKQGEFELAANASAVALDKGAAESIQFKDGVAVVTLPKAGAMLEVSVGGQKFNFQEL